MNLMSPTKAVDAISRITGVKSGSSWPFRVFSYLCAGETCNSDQTNAVLSIMACADFDWGGVYDKSCIHFDGDAGDICQEGLAFLCRAANREQCLAVDEKSRIDLMGKTADEVMDVLKDVGLSVSSYSDVTHLYENDLSGEYESVMCVFIDWRSQEGKLIYYILWDGRSVPMRVGNDLHGFVKPDGTIRWGQAHTMNMMR